MTNDGSSAMEPSKDVEDDAATDPAPADAQAVREERVSRIWHRGCTIGLGVAVVLYLVFALTSAPHTLEVIFAVIAFVMALAYMATTLWVFTLKTERKRSAPPSQNATSV